MDNRRLPSSLTRSAASSGGGAAQHNAKIRSAADSQEYHRSNHRTPFSEQSTGGGAAQHNAKIRRATDSQEYHRSNHRTPFLDHQRLTNGDVQFPPQRPQENSIHGSIVDGRPNPHRPRPFTEETVGSNQSRPQMSSAGRRQMNSRTQLDRENLPRSALHSSSNSVGEQRYVRNELPKNKTFDDYRKFRDDVPSRPTFNSLGSRFHKHPGKESDVGSKIALFEKEQSHSTCGISPKTTLANNEVIDEDYDSGRSSFVRNTSKRPRLRKRFSREAKPIENYCGYPEGGSITARSPYPGVWPDGGQGQFVPNNPGAVQAEYYYEAQSSASSVYHNAYNDHVQGPVYRPVVAPDYQTPEVVVDRRRSSSLGDILEGASDIYDVPYEHNHPGNCYPPAPGNPRISPNLVTKVYATCLYNESRTNLHDGKEAKNSCVRACNKDLSDRVPNAYPHSQYGSFHEVGLPYSNFAQVSLSTKSGPTVVNELSFLTHMPRVDNNSVSSRRHFTPAEPTLDESRFVYRAPIPRVNNGPYGASTLERDYRPSDDYRALTNNNLMSSKHDGYNSPLYAQTKSYEIPKYTIASNVSARRNVDSWLEKEFKSPGIGYQNRRSMSDPDIMANLDDNLSDDIGDRRVTDNKADGNYGRRRRFSKPEPVAAKLRKGSMPQTPFKEVGRQLRTTPEKGGRIDEYRDDTSSTFHSSNSNEDSTSKRRDVSKVVLGWQKRSQKTREMSSTSDSSECAKRGSDNSGKSSRKSDLSVKKSLSRSLQNLTARLGLRTPEKTKTSGGVSQLTNLVINDRRISSDVAYGQSRNGRLPSRRKSENISIDRNPSRYRDYQNHFSNSSSATTTVNKPAGSSFPIHQIVTGKGRPNTDEILTFVRPQSPEARKQRSISFDHHLLDTSDLRGVESTKKKEDQTWRSQVDPFVSDSCQNLEPTGYRNANKIRLNRSRHDDRTNSRNVPLSGRSGFSVHRGSETSQSSEDKVGPLWSQSSSSSYDRPNTHEERQSRRSAVNNSRLEGWDSNQASNAVKVIEHPQPKNHHATQKMNIRRLSLPTSENYSKVEVSAKIPIISESYARNYKSPISQHQPVTPNSNVASPIRMRETELESLKRRQPPEQSNMHPSTATGHVIFPHDQGRVRNPIPPNANIPEKIFHQSIESPSGSSLTDDYKQANQIRAVSKSMFDSKSSHKTVQYNSSEKGTSYMSQTRSTQRTEQSMFYSVEPSDIGVPLETMKISPSTNTGEEQNIIMRGRAMSDIEALMHTYVAQPSHFINKNNVIYFTQTLEDPTLPTHSSNQEFRTDVDNSRSHRNVLANEHEKLDLMPKFLPDRHDESRSQRNVDLTIHLPMPKDSIKLEVRAVSSVISGQHSKQSMGREQNGESHHDASLFSSGGTPSTEVCSNSNFSTHSASQPVAVTSSGIHLCDTTIENQINPDSLSVYEGCSGNCTNNVHNYSRQRSNSLLVNYSTDCFVDELDSSDNGESERISEGTLRKSSTKKTGCETGVVYRRQSSVFADTSSYEVSRNGTSRAASSTTTETNSVLSSLDGCSSLTDASLVVSGRSSNTNSKGKPIRHRKSGLTAELTVQAITTGSILSEGKRLGSSTFYVQGFPAESVSDHDKQAEFVQSDVAHDILESTKKESSSPSLSSRRRDGKQSGPDSSPGSPYTKRKRSEAKRARKLSDYLYSKMFNGCNNPSSSSFSGSDCDAKLSDPILKSGSLDRQSSAVGSLVTDSRKSSHDKNGSSNSNSPRLSVTSSSLMESPSSTLQHKMTQNLAHPSIEQEFGNKLTGTPRNKGRSSEVKPESTNKSPSIFARVASKFNKSGKYSSDSSEDHSGSNAKKALKYNTPTHLSEESPSGRYIKSQFGGSKAVGSKLSNFILTASDHKENHHDYAGSYDPHTTPKSSKKDASHLVLDLDLHNTTPRSRRHSKRRSQGNKSSTLSWSRNQKKRRNWVSPGGSYSPRSEEVGLAYSLQKRREEESVRVSSDLDDSDSYEDCSPSPTRRIPPRKPAAARKLPLKHANGRRVSASKTTVKRLKPGSKRRSIYRRGARRWRKLYKVNGHIYQAKRFNRRASCAICQDRIWGLGRQGFKCTQCKLLVHKKCSKLQTRPCTSEHFDTSTDTVLSHDTTATTTGSLASNDRQGSMAAAAATGGGGHHRNRSSMSTLPAGDLLSVAQQQQAAANSKPALLHEEAVQAVGGDTEGTEEAAVEMPPGECVSPSSPATTGQYSLADFELLRVIGRGSYAKVLMVELKRTGRIYAMKVIKKTLVTDDEDIDWVQTEKHVFETASNHPFLVGLHSCFQTPARLFFVIEFVRGGDLMFHMQRQRRLHEEHARFYAAEICLALNFLHEKGIIYRDLKLDNVLLDHEGHIKLTDYGMCKEGIRPGDTTSTFCGTPNYIAPEILQGVEYSFSVDWWALGVLLYEMLAGKSPFDIVGANDNPDFNTEDFLFQVILERPIRIPRSLSVKAASILKGFLNKNPSDRLGCHPETGFTDIISHPFFRTIDWEMLESRQVPPPHRPRLEGDRDLANFPPEFTDEPIQLTPDQQRDIDNIDQSEFEGFEYVNPLLMSMEDCV